METCRLYSKQLESFLPFQAFCYGEEFYTSQRTRKVGARVRAGNLFGGTTRITAIEFIPFALVFRVSKFD